MKTYADFDPDDLTILRQAIADFTNEHARGSSALSKRIRSVYDRFNAAASEAISDNHSLELVGPDEEEKADDNDEESQDG